MLTYNLKDGKDPLYITLYSSIKDDIVKGRLLPGEALPSKRRLAENNGISVITVENAYALLLDEGYIYSKPRSGFFVSDISALPGEKKREEKTENYEDSIVNEAEYIADFASGRTPSDLFPFQLWLQATRKVITKEKEKLVENPPSEGVLSLRRSIQRYLEEYRGLSVEAESIVIGAGSEYLYTLLISLIGRGKIYGLENPGYRKVERIYLSEGVRLEHLPLDEYGVIPSVLEEKKPDVLHITPSHQYPTGIVMPVSRRYELLAWASGKDGRYIIEDDYDSELRLDGRPVPALSSIDAEGRVIYINTFSKTLSSTVRISYMVLPPALMKRYREEFSFYSSPVSSFEQYTLGEFMESGEMGRHINRLRTYYRRKRDALIESLKRHLGERVVITGEKAGLHFLMHVTSDKSGEEILRDARRAGITLSSLCGFYHRKEDCPEERKKTFVMNYSSLGIEEIESVVEKLSLIF